MAGHQRSSTSYAITRALQSQSSSQRLPKSLEDLLNRVGIARLVGRTMRKPSYFQWTENRFTRSKMLGTQSIVIPFGDLALEAGHYN
jgi:hypothetical protein